MKLIKIFCKNTGQYHEVPKGATLEEVYTSLGLQHPCCVTSCKVNNRVEGLHYTINDSRDLEFLTLTSLSGLRTYTRSLFSCSTRPHATSSLVLTFASAPPWQADTIATSNSKVV